MTLLGVCAVARMLNVSEQQVRRLADSGKLPLVGRAGRTRVFDATAVRALVAFDRDACRASDVDADDEMSRRELN
jgi:hypothetical protein